MATALESYMVFLHNAVESGNITTRELLESFGPLVEYGQGCEVSELDKVLMNSRQFKRLSNWPISNDVIDLPIFPWLEKEKN